MAASLGKLPFGKALLCATSVVKAVVVLKMEPLQVVYKEISVFMSTNEPFWQINLLPFCLSVSFEEMILPSGKKTV